MAFNLTISALHDYTDDREFERLCVDLLLPEFRTVVPLGKTGDRGRDAVASYTYVAGEQDEYLFQFSLQEDWRSKIRREWEKIKEAGLQPRTYFLEIL